MNQILATQRETDDRRKKKTRNSDDDNRFSLSSIVRFFAIVLIFFGIALSSNGAYAIYQNNNSSGNIAKPVIQIEREDAENVVIRVSSSIGIKQITYSVNGVSNTIELNNELQKDINVKLEKSSNDIIINVKDKKKQEATYQKTITRGPTLILEPNAEEAIVNVTAESGNKIDYIEYWWDNGTKKKEMINNSTAELSINVIQDEHTLNVKVVDIEEMETTKSVKTIGVKSPIVEVTTNKVEFVVEASDEEEITKVDITLNGQELETEEDINSKTYTKKLKLKQGENKIIVTVYNNKNISTTKKVRYELK